MRRLSLRLMVTVGVIVGAVALCTVSAEPEQDEQKNRDARETRTACPHAETHGRDDDRLERRCVPHGSSAGVVLDPIPWTV